MINLKKDFSLNVDVNRHSFKNCLRENGMEKLRRRNRAYGSTKLTSLFNTRFHYLYIKRSVHE